jgi:hypothetical protein
VQFAPDAKCARKCAIKELGAGIVRMRLSAIPRTPQ